MRHQDYTPTGISYVGCAPLRRIRLVSMCATVTRNYILRVFVLLRLFPASLYRLFCFSLPFWFYNGRFTSLGQHAATVGEHYNTDHYMSSATG